MTRTCEAFDCERPALRKGNRGRLPLYCSRRCRKRMEGMRARRDPRALGFAPTIIHPERPCIDAICFCGRDYASLPL